MMAQDWVATFCKCVNWDFQLILNCRVIWNGQIIWNCRNRTNGITFCRITYFQIHSEASLPIIYFNYIDFLEISFFIPVCVQYLAIPGSQGVQRIVTQQSSYRPKIVKVSVTPNAKCLKLCCGRNACAIKQQIFMKGRELH